MNNRYRILSMRGRSHAKWVFGEEVARRLATERYEETDIPVMIVSHPVGELVKLVDIIGGEKRTGRLR